MVILGLSKGGFSSISLLTVPLMALIISPVQAAGIIQPILLLNDVVAVIAYWGIFDKRTVWITPPRLDRRRRTRMADRSLGHRSRGCA